MNIGFDPERHLLSVDLQNGLPEFTLRVDELVIKYYAEGVILSAGITELGIDLMVWPTPEDPSTVVVMPDGDGRWVVRVTPEDMPPERIRR